MAKKIYFIGKNGFVPQDNSWRRYALSGRIVLVALAWYIASLFPGVIGWLVAFLLTLVLLKPFLPQPKGPSSYLPSQPKAPFFNTVDLDADLQDLKSGQESTSDLNGRRRP